jgi:tetratricopeptide (TPR) repeat protein
VALVGWDAADWKVIHPLLDRGLMPNLQSLIERGVMGNIATLTPPLSPLLWTSIITGKTADLHGVLGFVEPDPVKGTLRPVASTARKCKALWNILSQSGLRSLAVNWFASHPAEPIAGAVVSNTFRTATHAPGSEWPVPLGTVHPAALEEELAALRVSPADLTGDDLLPFIPQLARIDQAVDTRPLVLATMLAEDITTHAAATHLMEHEEWEFLAVYYDAIDHAGHLFMNFHPPRMESASAEDFELYRGVIDGVYCFEDMMLGRLIELAGPDTTFLVVSDHGFQSGQMRPSGPANFTLSNAMDWHRPYGILVMAGPGIRHDELVFGAGLLDIAPTVLQLLGLPAAEDMPGRLLAEAFEVPAAPQRIPTWEDVPGESGMHPLERQEDSWEACAVVQQLIALGYVEHRDGDIEKQLDAARRLQSFSLARVHLAAARFAEAIPLLERLLREEPDNRVYRLFLAQSYCEAGRLDDCRAAVEPVLQNDADRPMASMVRGNLAIIEGDLAGGLAHLLRAEQTTKPLPEMRLAIGRVYLGLNRWQDAERAFRAVLEIDSDSAAAHAGLARMFLGKQDAQAAAAAAMDAIALRFDEASSHHLLGIALVRLGVVERAAQALETCLALQPKMVAAGLLLTALHAQAAGKR